MTVLSVSQDGDLQDRERAKRARFPVIIAALLGLVGAMVMGHGLWIKGKAVVAQILLSQAFEQSIALGIPVKPWRWADTWPIARIDVDRLHASAIVLAGASGQAMAFGPGHLSHTPLPGDNGTSVIAAHRDTHFAFLKDLVIGDEISVTRANGATTVFRVSGFTTTRWDAPGLDANASGTHLVLATCWPFDAVTPGPLRYLVKAEAVR